MSLLIEGDRRLPQSITEGAKKVGRLVTKPINVLRVGAVLATVGVIGVGFENIQISEEVSRVYPDVPKGDLDKANGIKAEVYSAVDDAIRKGRTTIDIPSIVDYPSVVTAQETVDTAGNNPVKRKQLFTDLQAQLPEDSTGTKGAFIFVLGVGTIFAGFALQIRQYLMRIRPSQYPQVEDTITP